MANDTKLEGGWHEPSANARQVGGDHYKMEGEQHWDRAWRLGMDPFQYQITKYVERWKLKNGIQDLEKAKHFIEKYIELARMGGIKGRLERQIEDERGQFESSLYDHVRAELAKENKYTTFALEWVLKNKVLTETGVITIDGREYTCLKGKPSDFEHEGTFGDGRARWRCVACRQWFYVPVGTLPHSGHACPTDPFSA